MDKKTISYLRFVVIFIVSFSGAFALTSAVAPATIGTTDDTLFSNTSPQFSFYTHRGGLGSADVYAKSANTSLPPLMKFKASVVTDNVFLSNPMTDDDLKKYPLPPSSGNTLDNIDACVPDIEVWYSDVYPSDRNGFALGDGENKYVKQIVTPMNISGKQKILVERTAFYGIAVAARTLSHSVEISRSTHSDYFVGVDSETFLGALDNPAFNDETYGTFTWTDIKTAATAATARINFYVDLVIIDPSTRGTVVTEDETKLITYDDSWHGIMDANIVDSRADFVSVISDDANFINGLPPKYSQMINSIDDPPITDAVDETNYNRDISSYRNVNFGDSKTFDSELIKTNSMPIHVNEFATGKTSGPLRILDVSSEYLGNVRYNTSLPSIGTEDVDVSAPAAARALDLTAYLRPKVQDYKTQLDYDKAKWRHHNHFGIDCGYESMNADEHHTQYYYSGVYISEVYYMAKVVFTTRSVALYDYNVKSIDENDDLLTNPNFNPWVWTSANPDQFGDVSGAQSILFSPPAPFWESIMGTVVTVLVIIAVIAVVIVVGVLVYKYGPKKKGRNIPSTDGNARGCRVDGGGNATSGRHISTRIGQVERSPSSRDRIAKYRKS